MYETGGQEELLFHLSLFERLESGVSLAESHFAHVKSLSTHQDPIAGKAISGQEWHTLYEDSEQEHPGILQASSAGHQPSYVGGVLDWDSRLLPCSPDSQQQNYV